jgi:hypothetical protein
LTDLPLPWKEIRRFTAITNHAVSLLLLETFKEEMHARRKDTTGLVHLHQA